MIHWLMGLIALVFLSAAKAPDQVSIGQAYALAAKDKVARHVVVIGAPARIDGQVLGSVIVVGGDLQLGSTSLVGRDVVVLGGQFKRAPGSRVLGETTRVDLPHLPRIGLPELPPVWLQSLLLLAGILILGALLPEVVGQATATLAAAWPQALFWGFLTWLFIPISGILLLFTLVGIILLPVHAIASILLAITSLSITGQWLGTRLLTRQPAWRQRALGAVLLVAIGWIPWLGPLTEIAAIFFGSGALAMRFLSRQRAILEAQP